MDQPNNEVSDAEAAKRRDKALRRALNTPPQPHKDSGKLKKSPAKRTAGQGRARVGKSKS